MDKKGEIDNLSRIISPDVGVITNISYAHAKNFKTLFDIAKAKAEIINNINSSGTMKMIDFTIFLQFSEKIRNYFFWKR